MDVVHRKSFTGTVSPPLGNLRSAISIEAGKRLVTEVDAGGGVGKLLRIYCKQASGTSVGYTVRLQTTSKAYGTGSATPANYNASVVGNPDVWDVLPSQTATAGNAVDVRYELGHGFANDDSSSPTNRERKLYLVIIPTAAADTTTWDVSLTFSNPR